MQKGFVVGWVLVLVLILITLGGGYYYWQQKNNSTEQVGIIITPPVTPSPIPTNSSATTSAQIANWKTYTSQDFSIKYPPNMSIKEENNSSGKSLGKITNIYFNDNKDCSVCVGINIVVSTVPVDRSIIQAISEGDSPNGSYPAEEVTFQKFTFDGVSGLISQDGVPAAGYAQDAFVIKKNLYSFRFYDDSSDTLEVYQKRLSIFPTILSTFKFTQ